MSIYKANMMGGGFVLHKLPLGRARRTSAWYDAQGKLLSCVIYRMLTKGEGRVAVADGPIWEAAARYGRIYAAPINQKQSTLAELI